MLFEAKGTSFGFQDFFLFIAFESETKDLTHVEAWRSGSRICGRTNSQPLMILAVFLKRTAVHFTPLGPPLLLYNSNSSLAVASWYPFIHSCISAKRLSS